MYVSALLFPGLLGLILCSSLGDTFHLGSHKIREIAKTASLQSTNANLSQPTDPKSEPFLCTPENLALFFDAKKSYRFIDFLILQDILSTLLVTQARVLDNFKFLVKLPSDLKDKTKLENFVKNFNQYTSVIYEREELILCDIMSSLLALRSKNYTRMESFLLANETGEVNINGTECYTELDNYSSAVDQGDLTITKEFYDQFLDCTYKLILSLTKIAESFTPSIRELEYRLVNLMQLTKSNFIENLNLFTNKTQQFINFNLTN
ncbi:hypothetical protein BpHYR1_012275 [Brachionus plicatilis]|uniref:Uncharacterized protein n=1 Tax=Brachionus plicatilis TaxID=10195 RepID=A0A3M7PNI5_BRAPC|nr:hypothetical protein BpHYR1_012275 [Brachionus plicatilis]